jgi:ribosome-associated protein
MSQKTENTGNAAVGGGDYSAFGSWGAVSECARFLMDEKAQDVQVLQVAARSSFADFFIIATAQSLGHLKGLVRNVDEVLAKHDIRAKGGKRSVNDDDTWVLLDCGDFIVHLMMREAREFYDLEKLWFDSPRLAEFV